MRIKTKVAVYKAIGLNSTLFIGDLGSVQEASEVVGEISRTISAAHSWTEVVG